MQLQYLHCALAAAQCTVIGPACLWVCLWLTVLWLCCGSVTMITRNCIHRYSQTGSVGEGSDHLQLIKFWTSRTPRMRV